MVQIISGKRITEEKIKSAAKCAVSAIMSELPEEVQTVDIYLPGIYLAGYTP